MQCHATLHCKYVPDFRVCLNMQGFGFMRQGCLNSFDILFGSYTDSCTDVSLLTGEYLQLYLTTPPPGRWCAPTETVWGKHQTSSARVSPEAGGRPPRKKNFLSTLSQDQMRDIRGVNTGFINCFRVLHVQFAKGGTTCIVLGVSTETRDLQDIPLRQRTII